MALADKVGGHVELHLVAVSCTYWHLRRHVVGATESEREREKQRGKSYTGTGRPRETCGRRRARDACEEGRIVSAAAAASTRTGQQQDGQQICATRLESCFAELLSACCQLASGETVGGGAQRVRPHFT